MGIDTREEGYDVAVVGGGPSGVCAAIAAARAGMKTVLLERHEYLGGVATAAMFQPWRGFHSFGRHLVTGIGEEIVQHLKSVGASPGHLIDPTGVSFSVTPFDSKMLKSVLEGFASAAGVQLMVRSEFAGVTMEGNDIGSLRVKCNEEELRVRAGVFVDATGDGYVAARAGVNCLNHARPAAYRFSMQNVDEKAVLEYAVRNPHEFSGVPSTSGNDFLSVKGFSTLTKMWLDQSPALSRSDSIQVDGSVRKGEVVVSMITLPNVDPSDPQNIVRAKMRCRELAPKGAKFLIDNCPGFSGSAILAQAQELGFHSLRQVCGVVTLTDSDVMSGKTFDDSVATCAMPGRPSNTFQVSRRALFNPKVENLLITGRAVLPPTALFATNSQPASMQLGEAAGAMAREMNVALKRKG